LSSFNLFESSSSRVHLLMVLYVGIVA
jgi:hypothetical protein